VTLGDWPRSLFITNDFPPRIGGSQTYHWGLIQTIPPDRVVVLAPAHRDAAEFDAGHPYRVVRDTYSQLLPTPRLLTKALTLAREEHVDLVQLGHPLPSGLLGPEIRRRTGLPYVVFLAGAELTLPGVVPVMGQLLRHVLRGASLLLTVSGYTARAAAAQAGGRAPAHELLPALEEDRFRPAHPDVKAAVKAALGIRGDLVVCLGRLVPRKGQDRLVDALALLDGRPDLNLALIGGGRLDGALRARARRLGVSDRVHMPGPLGHEDVQMWFTAADAFASPCRTRWGGFEVEGFGIVFAEAALAGLPVMAGRSGGAPEAVTAGDTGIVVDGATAAEVADGLDRLLRLSTRERGLMGARGRALALARHAPEAAARRYRDLLTTAASSGE
jgi:phosphatidyl-myo-inositol dimannoside synthase